MNKYNTSLIKHILFWVSYLTAFWGAFEMAYQSGSHPIWSGTWGFPVLHHYVFGFVGIFVIYISFTKNDFIIKEDIIETFLKYEKEKNV